MKRWDGRNQPAGLPAGGKVAFWDYDARYFKETMNVGKVAGVNYCW